MNCRRCEREIPHGAVFCPHCGIRLQGRPSPGSKALTMLREVVAKLAKSWQIIVAIALPVAIVVGMLTAFAQSIPPDSAIPYSGEIILGGVIVGTVSFPLLLAVYLRRLMADQTRKLGPGAEHFVQEWKDTAADSYAIPLSTLATFPDYPARIRNSSLGLLAFAF